jgi:hypothetical protein
MEFGAMVVRPTRPYKQVWVKVDFARAAFAAAKPRRDDENLSDVSGYDIVPQRRNGRYDSYERREIEWLQTGVCPDPGFYYSTSSTWLATERQSWANRQRSVAGPEVAIHFVVNGRDGYVEILASGFSWRAWRQGNPVLSEIQGDPELSGQWDEDVT